MDDETFEHVDKFVLDPIIARMHVGDVRILLEDALEGLEFDCDRVQAILEMLQP